MSISMKSSKSQMYSEIERLRALLDVRDANIVLQAETIERCDDAITHLRDKVEDLTTQLQGRAQQTAARGDRATRMLITKRLAISLGATVRWNDDNGFEHYVDGQWNVVPRHTLEFVMRGLQA